MDFAYFNYGYNVAKKFGKIFINLVCSNHFHTATSMRKGTMFFRLSKPKRYFLFAVVVKIVIVVSFHLNSKQKFIFG